jgi:hypothetical protein
MKIILTENQLNKVLLEYVVAPFVDLHTPSEDDDEFPPHKYEFKFELGGLTYDVSFTKTTGDMIFNLVFDYEGGNENVGAGKDISHFNSVLYTIFDIIKYAVNKYKIKVVQFDGVWGIGESPMKNNKLQSDSLRSRVYRRFLYDKYPTQSIHELDNRTYVDMTMVYPKLFDTGPQKRPVDMIFALIERHTGNSFTLHDKKTFSGYDYKNDRDFALYIDKLKPVKGKDLITISVVCDLNNKIYGLIVETDNYYAENEMYTFRDLYERLNDDLTDAIKS